MSKDEFAEYLRGKGYNAINDKGCVTVLVPEITKKIKREITRCVKECNYDMSYGLREVRDGE